MKNNRIRIQNEEDKMKCPCNECKLKESCPDMYACSEWVEWAMEEE